MQQPGGTSDQPLLQEHEDPVEAMELDATEQHCNLWIKIEDIHLTEANKLILMEGGQHTSRHMNAVERLPIWNVCPWQW